MNIALLTPREYEVAEQITLGLSESEIGAKLHIAYDTVHTHAYRIRKKLKASCSVDVARSFILSLDDPKHYFDAIGLLVALTVLFT